MNTYLEGGSWKGLKLSQIILKYVNILPAKFDFKKSEAEQS